MKIASEGNMDQEIDHFVDLFWMFEIAKRDENPIQGIPGFRDFKIRDSRYFVILSGSNS